MSYYKFAPDGAGAYGSFEVFYILPGNGAGAHDELAPGWYWWACEPGCLPDSEPHGPFKTEQEAIDDAQEGA